MRDVFQAITRAWSGLMVWLFRDRPPMTPEPAEAIAPAPQPDVPSSDILSVAEVNIEVAPAAPSPGGAPAEKSGAPPRREIATLKTEVLDNLADYQVYIRRLKKADPDTYREYRRLGAFINTTGSANDWIEARRLDASFCATLPGFGAVFMPRSETPENSKIYPRFLCFRKMDKAGPEVERANGGVTYICTLYFDDVTLIGDWKAGLSTEYAINVQRDGSMRALRILKSQRQEIRHRRERQPSVIHHQKWGLPQISQHPTSAEDLKRHFMFMCNYWLQAARSSMIRVTATKGSIVMPFVVDVLDASAFFNDRDQALGRDGKAKRIFHVVRPHTRTANGVTKAVKMHFRGLRQFVWNGYQIGITVPGREHVDLADVDLIARHEDEAEPGVEYTSAVEAAEVLADAIGAPAKMDRVA